MSNLTHPEARPVLTNLRRRVGLPVGKGRSPAGAPSGPLLSEERRYRQLEVAHQP